LNSSYWVHDFGVYIAKNFKKLQKLVQIASKFKNPLEDYKFFLNQCDAFFMKAENHGLSNKESLEMFLHSSWCCMAAAEVDHYNYSKYTSKEREQMRQSFYTKYLDDKTANISVLEDLEDVSPCRVDLIPPVALERLGIHNELCAIKWNDPTVWKREGFVVSKRIDSLKRHLDSCHLLDQSEDHIAHLTWNFMAVYHVVVVFPYLNDLVDYEALKNRK
jgi:hypothetical protein